MISIRVMPHGAFVLIERHREHANVPTSWGIFSTRTGCRVAGHKLELAPERVLRVLAGRKAHS